MLKFQLIRYHRDELTVCRFYFGHADSVKWFYINIFTIFIRYGFLIRVFIGKDRLLLSVDFSKYSANLQIEIEWFVICTKKNQRAALAAFYLNRQEYPFHCSVKAPISKSLSVNNRKLRNYYVIYWENNGKVVAFLPNLMYYLLKSIVQAGWAFEPPIRR
jgi:hypothetical protein